MRAGKEATMQAVLVACGALVFGLYAVLGTNYVLDDWFTLRNAEFDGAWAAGSGQFTARPGAWLVYGIVFGMGRHPLIVLAIQAVIGTATAVVFFRLLRRFVPVELAFAAALAWLVLPNHTSLEVWASATNIALSTLLVVGAALLLARDELETPRLVAAVACLAGSALCYEAVIPLAAAVAIGVPWLAAGRINKRAVVAAFVVLGAVALWIVTHWKPEKHVASANADMSQMLGAHLGWGVVPDGPVASLALLIGLIGIAAATIRLIRSESRSSCGPPEWMVVVGVGVVLLGSLPFVRYVYAPLGAGDRFSFVSALGGAMVWAGIFGMVLPWRRPVALAGAAVLLVAGTVARVERSVLWHRAGHDSIAIMDKTVAQIPDPRGVVVLGPRPIQQQNIAAYLDQSNVDSAIQLFYGSTDVRGGIAFSEKQWLEIPAEQRVDIRDVSLLSPDVVVGE